MSSQPGFGLWFLLVTTSTTSPVVSFSLIDTNLPFTNPPTLVAIRDNKKVKCYLYTIGVDAGKSKIMSRLKVQEKGAGYMHFPRGEQGYDKAFFEGLLSEKLVLTRTSRGDVWRWEKLPGHRRNEALDCRNYALAAMQVAAPNLDAVERRLRGLPEQEKTDPASLTEEQCREIIASSEEKKKSVRKSASRK